MNLKHAIYNYESSQLDLKFEEFDNWFYVVGNSAYELFKFTTKHEDVSLMYLSREMSISSKEHVVIHLNFKNIKGIVKAYDYPLVLPKNPSKKPVSKPEVERISPAIKGLFLKLRNYDVEFKAECPSHKFINATPEDIDVLTEEISFTDFNCVKNITFRFKGSSEVFKGVLVDSGEKSSTSFDSSKLPRACNVSVEYLKPESDNSKPEPVVYNLICHKAKPKVVVNVKNYDISHLELWGKKFYTIKKLDSNVISSIISGSPVEPVYKCMRGSKHVGLMLRIRPARDSKYTYFDAFINDELNECEKPKKVLCDGPPSTSSSFTPLTIKLNPECEAHDVFKKLWHKREVTGGYLETENNSVSGSTNTSKPEVTFNQFREILSLCDNLEFKDILTAFETFTLINEGGK